MNNIRKTIGWADLSWNPIKGLCPVGCWYCYARAMYKRFKRDPEPWLDIAELNAMSETKRTGKRIFVCSTFDLFHPAVDSMLIRCVKPDGERGLGKARDAIFDVIQRRPDLTFIVLTKLPERIDRPMPPNVWLGVSVTGIIDWERRVNILMRADASLRFVSMEPLLGNVPDLRPRPDWLIVGRLTGRGTINNPPADHLRKIREQCQGDDIPLFEKSNLRGILYGPLIQEFPR